MLEIIKAEPRHAEEMHEIEAACFAAPWSDVSIRHEISHKHSIAFVAVENNTILGHVYMRHIVNEGHIINIAVRENHRRRGIASILVDALISAARSLEMIGLTLEVRKSNAAAIALYEKHGFSPEGIRKNYYSHPTEDGIIMWLYFKI